MILKSIEIGSSGEKHMFSPEQIEKLVVNGNRHGADHVNVPYALLKGESTLWLISELYENSSDVAYGITCSDGHITLGEIDLTDINTRYEKGEVIFNDPSFDTSYSIEVFKKVADEIGLLITDEDLFSAKFRKYSL